MSKARGLADLGNAYSDGALSNRNAVINGNFDVWQRGISQTSSSYGSDDRWANYNFGSTKVASQQVFALGQTDVVGNPKYYSRTVVTSVAGAGNYVLKRQSIEGVTTFSGETVTFTFWAKADANKNIAVEFYQNFGSGGSPSGLVFLPSQTVSLTTSWAKHSLTFDIPSVSGKTLGTDGADSLSFHFWFDAGSDYNSRTNSLGQQSGTFDISQVQLEVGDTATPFEHRSYSDQLQSCMRYYYEAPSRSLSLANATTSGYSFREPRSVQITFPVTMRATPTAVRVTTEETLSGGVILRVSDGSVTCVPVSYAGDIPSGTYSYGHATLDAEL
jgi:hypothetical protein